MRQRRAFSAPWREGGRPGGQAFVDRVGLCAEETVRLVGKGAAPARGTYGSACFLCHRTLQCRDTAHAEAVVPAEEDVVPKWLLRMFSLGNTSAALPNGQLRGYGQRKVPCCFECNQRMSAYLEQPARASIAAGVEAVRTLDSTTLFLWLAKLYYGTRFYETRFRTDVADPTAPAMLEHSELLDRNDYLRRLLLTNPQDLTLVTPPGTTFVFGAGVPKIPQTRFDFFVSTFADVDLISVRMGEVFIVAIFGDNGHWVDAFGSMRIVQHAAREMTLHPAQCSEISVWLTCLAAAHDKSGCWNFVTIAGSPEADAAPAPPGTPDAPIPPSGSRTLFASNFEVVANNAPAEAVQFLRANSFLSRLGFQMTPDELASAREGTYSPTLLLDVRAHEPVQAACFELRCPGLFHLAGWRTALPTCPECGAAGDREAPA